MLSDYMSYDDVTRRVAEYGRMLDTGLTLVRVGKDHGGRLTMPVLQGEATTEPGDQFVAVGANLIRWANMQLSNITDAPTRVSMAKEILEMEDACKKVGAMMVAVEEMTSQVKAQLKVLEYERSNGDKGE